LSRRDQIKLSDGELRELIGRERVVVVSTLGRRGWPHSMPMWFVPRDGEIWIWTYAKSQKVRNLERDDRATLLVETGREYAELRGAMIEARAEIHRDFDTVLAFAEELTIRYAEGISSVEGDAKGGLEAQAPKRVAIRFEPVRTATWDHRKLGGTYSLGVVGSEQGPIDSESGAGIGRPPSGPARTRPASGRP
jgi:PPOX class probable F420-dependent enzyme